MHDADPPSAVRADLLERLRTLDSEQGAGSLAELAYRRAKEALQMALEEARSIRLQAIDDARRAREEEMAAMRRTLQSQRVAAEAAIEALIRQAEVEAERIRARAHQDAEGIVAAAEAEARTVQSTASQALEEARAVRASLEQRQADMDVIEKEFDRSVAQIAERIGVSEKPSRGWWRRLTSSGDDAGR